MTVFAVEYVYAADSTEARNEARPAHREWLAGLAQDGAVLASGPYGDGAGALLIFKTADEAALNSILKRIRSPPPESSPGPASRSGHPSSACSPDSSRSRLNTFKF
jgi:uncharacterized protein YciI